MNMRVVVCAAVAAVLWAGPRAHAQTFETVGIRAQGMGGAFVAVADDATATWWNPAGLATGALFSGVWERGTTTETGELTGAGPGWRGDSSGVAIAFPAMGLSYYRLRVSEIQPTSSTAGEDVAREDQGVSYRTRAVSQYGLTAGQSLGDFLVIASTLKLVRAGRAASTGTVAPDADGDDTIQAAADLDTDAETSVGLDMGAMLRMGYARAGVTIRNLREPEFGDGDEKFVLERHVRGGFALVGGPVGAIAGATAAVDADFTTFETVFGETRHIAAGGELWLFGRHLGLRGGISRNMVGLEQLSKSAGVSFAAQTGLYVDGMVTFGSDESRKGWSVGARVTF